jgi:hypothetical protein
MRYLAANAAKNIAFADRCEPSTLETEAGGRLQLASSGNVPVFQQLFVWCAVGWNKQIRSDLFQSGAHVLFGTRLQLRFMAVQQLTRPLGSDNNQRILAVRFCHQQVNRWIQQSISLPSIH